MPLQTAQVASVGKSRKWSQLPTSAEIAAFTGLHCTRIYWGCVGSRWQCPCCDRSAQELIRWSEITGQYWRAHYGDTWGMGWTISFARHHCHNAESGGMGQRFETTLICGDCNGADGAAKRKLGLPAWWSFSPAEIREFVQCVAWSGRTVIDYEVAAAIYTGVMAGFGRAAA
jgi:hypothetical protein